MQTISCLLIHPNPDSALNSAAGALLQDDYEAFAKQARLMTSIHAPIPPDLRDLVLEAKRRGEEPGPGQKHNAPQHAATSAASSVFKSVVLKHQAVSNPQQADRASGRAPLSMSGSAHSTEDQEEGDDVKENDPCHSPSPVLLNHGSSRRLALGKRPLSELHTPMDVDDTHCSTTVAEDNAAYGQLSNIDNGLSSEPMKKSSKLDLSTANLNTQHNLRQETRPLLTNDGGFLVSTVSDSGDDKENMEGIQGRAHDHVSKDITRQPGCQAPEHPQRPTLRKVSNVGSSRLKGQARIGIRRL